MPLQRTPGPPPAAATQTGYRIRTGQQIVGLVYSNQAFTLFGRFSVVYDDGSVDLWPVVEVASGSSRAPVVWDTGQIALKDGYVIGGAIIGRSLPSLRGQAFVQGFITDANASPGATSDQILSGYLYTGHAVVLGQNTEPGPQGGSGMFKEVTTADPAAGSDIASQTVPVGAMWRLVSVSVQLVQGITQTPLPTLLITTGTPLTMVQVPITPTAIGASSTAQLTWAIGLVQTSFTAVVGDEFHTAPLPDAYIMIPGEIWKTLTDGIGANTNYGAAQYLVEEWVIPN